MSPNAFSTNLSYCITDEITFKAKPSLDEDDYKEVNSPLINIFSPNRRVNFILMVLIERRTVVLLRQFIGRAISLCKPK